MQDELSLSSSETPPLKANFKDKVRNSIQHGANKILGPRKSKANTRPQIEFSYLSCIDNRIAAFNKRFRARGQHYSLLLVSAFTAIWLGLFILLVHLSHFAADTEIGQPTPISQIDRFWDSKYHCGLNGNECRPFVLSDEIALRCLYAATTEKALDEYRVGADRILNEPVVIGGTARVNDSDARVDAYRADSWLCASAWHAGVIGKKGGCFKVKLIGFAYDFKGSTSNGIRSLDFEPAFPKTYMLSKCTNGRFCTSLLPLITVFNAIMSLVFGLIAPPIYFFFILCAFFFWQVVLVSDMPTSWPIGDMISNGMAKFLVTFFAVFYIWRSSARKTLSELYVVNPLEYSLFYLIPAWIGLLSNITFQNIPIDRLTGKDMTKKPQITAFVIVLILFIGLAIWQAITLRKYGMFRFLLKRYAIIILLIILLSILPDVHLHLHHYFLCLLLLPATALQTRLSLALQGFLLGFFINGAARWGFDSILETSVTIARDGLMNSAVPSFFTNITHIDPVDGVINWHPAPAKLQNDGLEYSLLIDEVERYRGRDLNLNLSEFSDSVPFWDVTMHFFRIAYVFYENLQDYSDPAILYENGTFVAPK